MKLLNGADVATYIKERQSHQVRGLIQAHDVQPRLAIIRTNPDPVVDSYMRLKQAYGEEILVDVDVHSIDQQEAMQTIALLNDDPTVHGIIVQIPLPNVSQTDELLNSVAANKDVDGLAAITNFDPATPLAIDWLLAGYNINLQGANIVIIGQGRLVGLPLAQRWKSVGYNITTADRTTQDLAALTRDADIIICATGQPGILSANMVKENAVIVDAGVATDSNGLIGDVAQDVRSMPNIKITPEKGGVGPLTVAALFDNVIRAAQATTSK